MFNVNKTQFFFKIEISRESSSFKSVLVINVDYV